MKKLVLTIAIVMSFVMSVSAQEENKGGLFKRGPVPTDNSIYRDTPMLSLPAQHGLTNDQGNTSPVGSGMAVLVGLGAAYLVAQRRKEK